MSDFDNLVIPQLSETDWENGKVSLGAVINACRRAHATASDKYGYKSGDGGNNSQWALTGCGSDGESTWAVTRPAENIRASLQKIEFALTQSHNKK